MASTTPSFRRLTARLQSITQSYPRNTVVVGIFVGTFIACWKNYRDWRSAGPGGVPPNVKGWVLQWLYRLCASQDTLGTGCYTDPKVIQNYGSLGLKRFIIGDLPQRDGKRPVLLPWSIPHRQAPGTESDKVVRNVSTLD